jgi:hypothetical protein
MGQREGDMRNMRRLIRSTSSVFASVTVVLIGIVVLISSGVAIAAGGWSGSVKITSIEVSQVSAAGIWLSFTTPPFPSTACPGNNGQYKLGRTAAPGVITNPDIINQMALNATAALLNSKTVKVYWSGSCLSNYPILIGLTVE